MDYKYELLPLTLHRSTCYKRYRMYRKDSHTFNPRFPSQSWGCGDLSRCRLPPVINHSTLTYVCHYPGADCHQSSTIPPWPMCVTIQEQTATSHQPFHPGLCVSLSRAFPGFQISLANKLAKIVNHEGKQCLKVEQRHPPCLRKVPLS